jgi:hypothetical protein
VRIERRLTKCPIPPPRQSSFAILCPPHDAPSGRQGPEFGETLYLRSHRIRSGPQTITVTVPRKPSDAGIDPYLLLIDLERFDNVEEVEIEG